MATQQAADTEPNLTECAVCHDLFTVPKLLPCSHILCRGCLVTWLQSQPQAGCPLCRCAIVDPIKHKGRSVAEVVDGFPTDLAMTAMVEAETLLSKQHVCCVCVNVAAVALCLQCGDMYCQQCSNVHKKMTVSKHHEVEQLSSFTTEKLAAHHPATCPDHKDKVSEVYCISHDASLCVLCATTTHNTCCAKTTLSKKIGELTTELLVLEGKLSKAVTHSDNLIQRLEKHVQELERDSESALMELRKVFDRLKAAIETRFQSVKEETKNFVREVTKKVNDYRKYVMQIRSKTVTQQKMTELYGKFTEHKYFKDMVKMVKDRHIELVQVKDLPDNLQLNHKLIMSIDPQIMADIERNLSMLGDRMFTPDQTSKLYQSKSKHHVSIELDKKRNSVSITGCDTNVMEAVSNVKDFLLLATTERHLAAGGPPVRWQYAVDKDKFKDFDPENVIAIEAAFKKKESEVRFTDRHGQNWKMVFKDRKVYGPDGRSTAVKRRDLLEEKKDEIPLPSHWEPMKGEKVKRVLLQPDRGEYKRVAQHFGTQRAIKKIERIQNPTLFQQFKVKKKELDQYNPEGTENEKRLFHGTPDDSIESIIANGFNRCYCGRIGTALGAGVYFAADSSVSRGYAQGGHMFQARVLVGEYTPGNGGMKFAPNKPGQNRLFDSVANAASSATIFVIFHDSQAYPEYLITFQ